jgi:hypothetical protein
VIANQFGYPRRKSRGFQLNEASYPPSLQGKVPVSNDM